MLATTGECAKTAAPVTVKAEDGASARTCCEPCGSKTVKSETTAAKKDTAFR